MTSLILMAVLLLFAARILFAIEALLCQLIDILYQAFQIFAGITPITYNGNRTYIMNVFFSNDIITTVFWGMACIGFVLVLGFSIAAVIRRFFDYSNGEKVKSSYLQIILNAAKAILLIMLMTAIVSATISATGTLMQAVDKLFNNAERLAHTNSIVFGDEDFATMYRIMNTIGNYSVNPTYNTRFNVNSCFNAIRDDMQSLEEIGTFKFSYGSDEAKNSWQKALLAIYTCSDVYQDVDIDAYNDSLMKAMEDCMYNLKNNRNFLPLQSYSQGERIDTLGATLGRTIMLSCTFNCANNSKYNRNPSLLDSLRYPYYIGEKNIYSHGEAEDAFDIGLFSWNHVVCLAVAYFVIKEMAAILFNCVARLFNMVLLYLMAPGFLAVMPLDDGGKFKQWTTAYVIQSLSIFGSVFAVRLLMIFIPIINDPQLVLFENNGLANAIAKLFFVIGICVTSEKASGMISGILADNAGYQSIMAGDVGGGLVSKGLSVAGKVGGAVASKGFALGKGALGAVGDVSGLTTAKDNVSKKFSDAFTSMREKGGFSAAKKSGFKTAATEKQESEAAEKKSDKANQRDFMNKMASGIDGVTGTLQKMTEMLGGNGGGEQKGGGENPSNKGSNEEFGKKGGEGDGQKKGGKGGMLNNIKAMKPPIGAGKK